MLVTLQIDILAVNIVFEMKSLILLLYLGAVVFTLAENPFEDNSEQEYIDAGVGETIAELADERPRPSVRLPR